MVESELIAELRSRGWEQGSLFRAANAPVPWIRYGAAEPAKDPDVPVLESPLQAQMWGIEHEPLGDNAYFVISSQVCDLLKPPNKEPYVEVLVAYWTQDAAIAKAAALNSSRYFLLAHRRAANGAEESLVVDAARGTRVTKESLLNATRETAFTIDDTKTPRVFRDWLSDRLGRPPLPDDLVKAVQRPLVNAIRRLRAGDDRLRILSLIDHVLCFEDLPSTKPSEPLHVNLLLVRDEAGTSPSISREDSATVGGWFADLIAKGGGAVVRSCQTYTMQQVSARDFAHGYRIALDEFSLSTDEVAETGGDVERRLEAAAPSTKKRGNSRRKQTRADAKGLGAIEE